MARKYGDETAASFAWLKANPQALGSIQESPIAASRRLLAESAAAYRAGKPEEATLTLGALSFRPRALPRREELQTALPG